MLKRLVLIFFILFVSIGALNAAQVNITTNVYSNYTIFNYDIYFNKNESYSRISIEKPKGSELILANYANKSIKYSTAGDYFLFDFNSFKSNYFNIKFKSYSTSKNIYDTNSFLTYLNLNIPVENLEFKLYLNGEFGKVSEIFPRNYQLIGNNIYDWKLTNLQKDSLFLIKFDKAKQIVINPNINKISSDNFLTKYLFYIYFLIPTIIFLVLIILLYKKKSLFNFEKKSLEKNIKKEILQEIKNEKIIIGAKSNLENISEKKTFENEIESFNSILDKYLTENEKEIVILIKNHNGMAQYDILNYLPTLTKSNLSKIISKLHSRRFLNRIKVGKINKIHLGDKFENILKEEKNEE